MLKQQLNINACHAAAYRKEAGFDALYGAVAE